MSPAEFELEYPAHLPALMAFAARLTRNRSEAEDLVQESLLKAFGAREQFREGTHLRAWLLRILRNTFFNVHRRRGVERRAVEGLPAHDVGLQTIGAASLAGLKGEDELEETLLAAIDGLPLEFRDAVLLADVEELSYREIAQILDCPLGTVMSRLHRGRRLLRVALVEHARELGIGQGPTANTAQSTSKGADAEKAPSVEGASAEAVGARPVSLGEFKRRRGAQA
jgi:RNA polymerase sigma-70 factor, ECF subfamily